MGIMLIICFSDYWHNKEYLRIEANQQDRKPEFHYKLKSDRKSDLISNSAKRPLKCIIDAITYFYWRRELIQFNEFRSLLLQHPALRDVDFLRLQIIPPESLGFDWIWYKLSCNNFLQIKIYTFSFCHN